MRKVTNHNLYEIKPVKTGKQLAGQIVGFVISTFVVAFFCGVLYHPINDTIAGARYEPSAEMAEIIDQLNLTDRGLRILNATHPVLQAREEFAASGCNEAHSSTSTLGCYDSFNIYIYDSNNEELNGLEESTTAHELLHAVWARLAFYDTARLEPLLDEFYATHAEELSTYMSDYSAEQYYTELHSVIGTEFPASELPTELRQHYEAFFADFDKIYGYYHKYEAVIEQINTELEVLEKDIATRRAVIAEREAYYTQESEKLGADIRDFNHRANTEGAFSDQVSFNRERNALLSRQQAINTYYEETSRLIGEVNQKISEYNAKAIHHNTLIQSIDSKPQSSDELE